MLALCAAAAAAVGETATPRSRPQPALEREEKTTNPETQRTQLY
jgi:hypothetical protein